MKILSRLVRRYKPRPYWESRRELVYYQIARALVAGFGKNAKSIIDVGSSGCPYLEWFPNFSVRTSLDLRRPFVAPGIQSLTTNFLKWKPDRHYDVAMSLQVLEHVPDAHSFAQKLLSVADTVVVSVPYKWPEGRCKFHVHDPVDEEKMNRWFEREPHFEYVCTEPKGGVQRLIQVYT